MTYAEATLLTFDGTCKAVENETGIYSSGTVTLDTVNGNVTSGAFDLSLGEDFPFYGTFTTVACPGAATLLEPLPVPADNTCPSP